MRFNFTISHVPGKDLSTADALSRAPISSSTSEAELSSDEVDAYIRMAVNSIPATEARLEEVRAHQEGDWICKQVADYCRDGWPRKSTLHASLKPFCSVAGELSVQEGLLMRGSRIVIPTDMQAEVLSQCHFKEPTTSKAIGVVARHVC